MEEYEPRQNESAEASAGSQETQGDSSPGSDMADQTEMAFVVEGGSKARSAGIFLLGLVIAGAAAIYFMRLKSAPKAAKADSPAAKDANKTINQFLDDGGKNIRSMKDLLVDTEKFVQQFKLYPLKKQVQTEDLQTNPFLFAKKAQTPDEIEAARKQQMAKLQEQARQEAAKLKLQMILYSDTNARCMIGNQLYGKGQQVDGFLIETIERDRVIVSRGGIKFQLKAQR